jgi:hypothetical protein
MLASCNSRRWRGIIGKLSMQSLVQIRVRGAFRIEKFYRNGMHDLSVHIVGVSGGLVVDASCCVEVNVSEGVEGDDRASGLGYLL